MVRRRIDAWKGWLRRILSEPRGELTRWQRTFRFAYLLGLHGARRLRQGRAQEMSAALAFRTLFGLVPVLVVGTLLVRAFQGWQGLLDGTRKALASLGLDEVRVSFASGDSSVALSEWLLDLLSQVETINLTAIGWVGVIVLIYSALSLMLTIENSFNTIYRAPRGRSWTRRVPAYWFVLCLAPAAGALMLYVDNRVEGWIQQVEAGEWILGAAGSTWSLAVTWLILVAVYKIVPSTTVATRAALAGAGVSATLLWVGQQTLGAYLENALSIRQLYGSLGLIPLFMFWVYLMWLAVLYGLEVAATLQTVSRQELERTHAEPESDPSGLIDAAAVLSVMEFVARRFREGRAATPREITEATGLGAAAVQIMLARLLGEGLLHRVDREDQAVTLSRPPESIVAERLIRIGFAIVDEGRREFRSRLIDPLRNAQCEVASRSTLATLLAD